MAAWSRLRVRNWYDLAGTMKARRATRSTDSLTLVETVVVIAIVAVLVGMLLPALVLTKKRGCRILCVNNVKQVALVFRVWANDHNDKFPMQVPVADGGSLEWIESGMVAPHYRVMSNELSIPKILICPDDSTRKGALNFETNFTDANISYFVGVDGSVDRPGMLVSGERKITLNRAQLKRGLWSLDTNQNLGWARQIHLRHPYAGNVALANASVHQVDGSGLRNLLANSGVATNRLTIP